MIPYNKLSEKDKEIVIEMYDRFGYGSLKYISTAMNISRRAVARVLKEACINTKRKNNYTLNENYFKSITDQNRAYLLGLFYADGFVGGINHIAISLKSEDNINIIMDLLDFKGSIKDRISGFGYKQYLLNFSSKEMSEDLQTYGMYAGKAKEMLTIPSQVPKTLIRHFIRGYFDGDGSIYSTNSSTKSNGKKYTYKVYGVEIIGNIDFLQDLGRYLSEQGITFTFKKSKTEYMKYIRIKGGRNLRKLYKYLYEDADTFFVSKYSKWPT